MTTTTLDVNSIQDRVNSICNELYAKGTKPTVRLVLSMLPDVSSTSTVHKYFANWKKEIEANQQSLYDQLGFSSDFTQSFMKEITRFSVEAEQRYKEQAHDANDQRDLALEELQRSEDRLHKQSALIEQRDKEIKELQSELIKVQENLKAQLSQEQESNRVIVQELRQQLEAQTDETRTLTATNETLRTDIAKAELKLEGNQAYVEEVKTQNTALTSENKSLNGEITALNKQLASLEATISGNDKLIVSLEGSLSDLKETNQTLEKEKQQLNTDVVALRRDLDTAHHLQAETKEQLDDGRRQAEKQLADSEDRLRSLNQTISSHEATIKGNDKLIAQMETAQSKLTQDNAELKVELAKFSDKNNK